MKVGLQQYTGDRVCIELELCFINIQIELCYNRRTNIYKLLYLNAKLEFLANTKSDFMLSLVMGEVLNHIPYYIQYNQIHCCNI